ncbi:dephospho-CoA kinase [Sulfitobacter pseudonitzschiae]|uniref:Dephospho-CoA kinase n=1 Tax=Pseudosulfitobacter pseudonitzschiae TaxID=1402135 RepID=A0A9Q2NKG3_9RHOB|nr:dephospho-CoA kinase [Pseudosulfitobacter pseudonitzschiae]MBM2290610.1 dephospho-CoA kinase [Pseudosulfitobacter pseudonitzschiae]MBM2295528.1 dephospho-CoA kinase [Pseudosulfitobacter pseudonitzschiae]MBM2300440.1 dephospho-CoA kinase [Pseudosulfitobacter pseudonitzschiae]MBM2310225.1 dephospho-CoA kinase [Pseudosulfitobacter pseudonitzschiae]MBM2315137.1 dephospho-CoA kinase [Pseudosulfitobacter pseudonitzschiae]
MSFRLGLTGSIGMGKSTTAQLFAEAGCAVWDADAAVHRIYGKGGIGVEPMRALEPRAVIDDTVSRPSLRALIAEDPTLLERIEKIVHPLVGQDRQAFIDTAQADILVFDIPLLFETGGNARMDAVVCVSIPADLQQERVMARGTMTLEQFEQIKAKQMPNDDKVALSDYVVITDTMDHARAQVQAIVNTIKAGLSNA